MPAAKQPPRLTMREHDEKPARVKLLAPWITPVVASICLFADAASKNWALAHLTAGKIYPFIPGILQLTLTTNTGGAFGIGRNFKELMTVLAAVIAAGIIAWIVRRERSRNTPSLVERLGMALLLGGALGNIFDRLVLGCVTDFLDFAFVTFPVFNLADAAIDVGIGLLVVRSFFSSRLDEEPDRQEIHG